ncbi:hypothetical protein AJ80_05611 [Polytolypa hystricis UAMH7299]|uniref:Deoxyribose-phosphate aldolase n=1 Tax=Polytolypa hystricis (strain UAMH7299) TaxID=1447883 RepID=A0A2B7Y344_POLH7|nr:hypothetical protein AJ80_05611 [Polytolypa hystricis UAMH7299]
MAGHKQKKRKIAHSQRSEDNGGEIDTSKPTAVFTPSGGRSQTFSVAIAGSIIANAKSIEQKTYLAGSIARALAVFCVDEIVIFDDELPSKKKLRPDECTGYDDPSHFLAHVLSFLEAPAYMRKTFFPMHINLKFAGTLPSLDMPHHLRAHEWCEYREGVAVAKDQYSMYGDGKSKKQKGSKEEDGSGVYTLVDTGLPEYVRIPNLEIPEYTRTTVRFKSDDPADGADAVAPSAPREEVGYYWGYAVRRCETLSAVFTECPFDGGYDLSFGTSERGTPLSEVVASKTSIPKYKHAIVVIGGVAGLENAVKVDKELQARGIKPMEVDQVFDYWVNLLPGQGSRTIRAEEAVWLGLMGLQPVVERNNSL